MRGRLRWLAATWIAVATGAVGAALAEDAPREAAGGDDPAAVLRSAQELTERMHLLHERREYAAALSLAEESLALREKALGPEHPETAVGHFEVGVVLRAKGDYAAARGHFERSLRIRERAFGPDHLLVAMSLQHLGWVLARLGSYAEARSLAERTLVIRERALGPDHVEVGSSVLALGSVLLNQAAYTDARPQLERALEILERRLGPRAPVVADALEGLSNCMLALGSHREARPLSERALSIREETLGKDHPDVAAGLRSLAGILQREGSYREARSVLERALAITESSLGKAHVDAARCLVQLATALMALGEYAEARPLLDRALEIFTNTVGAEHPSVALTLNNIATLAHTQGAHGEARALLERALAIRERSLGAEHPDVAQTLSNLAVVLKFQGHYARSSELYERALAIREKVLGGAHPDLASTLQNHALVLAILGQHARSRSQLERALSIVEKSLGTSHPLTATILSSLARSLEETGDHEGACVLYERALVVRESMLGPDHPDVATALTNVAVASRALGRQEDPRPLLERALTIRRKALGPEHHLLATSLMQLAEVLAGRGAHEEAARHYERALEVMEKALPVDHPTVATGLHNHAEFLAVRGSRAEARVQFDRARAIWERTMGRDRPEVAAALHGVARLLEAEGDLEGARAHHAGALQVTERCVRAQFLGLTPAQRVALVRTTRHYLDDWLSFAPKVGLSGHAESLRLRGLVGRAESADRALWRHVSHDDSLLATELLAATHRLARLANEAPTSRADAGRSAWRARYAEAGADRERLALELARRCGAYARELARLDLGEVDVQRAIPSDAVLLDVLRVRDGYLGWTLRATGEARRVDLGPAADIDDACRSFLAALLEDRSDAPSRPAVAAAGARLRDLVWAPMAATWGDGVRRVVISPDAALTSIPFAALPGTKAGDYLLDELAITYVAHPYELVARAAGHVPSAGAVAVGGVDYQHAVAQSAQDRSRTGGVSLSRGISTPAGGGPFRPLPGARAEAEGLRDRLGAENTTLLLGDRATEAGLASAVPGKRFVHIATHAYFHEDPRRGLREEGAGGDISGGGLMQIAAGHDPMLRAGLALAGANVRDGADGGDGILSALEASYLDASAADLVILSACETARGSVHPGEGVVGLVSAFHLAGASRVIASLWQVGDEPTRLLMDGVYERVLRRHDPLPPAVALRASALALRDRRDEDGRFPFAAPRHWAAFVAYGR